jgi:hypothetical protein
MLYTRTSARDSTSCSSFTYLVLESDYARKASLLIEGMNFEGPGFQHLETFAAEVF